MSFNYSPFTAKIATPVATLRRDAEGRRILTLIERNGREHDKAQRAQDWAAVNDRIAPAWIGLVGALRRRALELAKGPA